MYYSILGISRHEIIPTTTLHIRIGKNKSFMSSVILFFSRLYHISTQLLESINKETTSNTGLIDHLLAGFCQALWEIAVAGKSREVSAAMIEKLVVSNQCSDEGSELLKQLANIFYWRSQEVNSHAASSSSWCKTGLSQTDYELQQIMPRKRGHRIA